MNSALVVMWDRQIKEYYRKKQRLIATLIQPLLFLIAFGFGVGAMYEQAGNGNYIQYLIPGIVGMTILMSSTMNGMSLIWDKQFGFLKATLVAPVSRTGLLFGRCLGGATTSTFQGLVVLFLGVIMGFRFTNIYLLPVAIVSMLAISLLFNLLGTSIASKFDDMQSFPLIMNFLVMPMIFISGALFPIENFPHILQVFVRLNPFTYCNDLLKYGLGVPTTFNVGVDVAVIGTLIILLGILGTWLFNRLEP
jgi:ABC-2 type transport system permease protein